VAYGGVTRERVYFSCCDVAKRERAERQEVRRDCTVPFFFFGNSQKSEIKGNPMWSMWQKRMCLKRHFSFDAPVDTIERGRYYGRYSPWQKQPPFGSGPFSLREPSAVRVRRPERIDSRRLTSWLFWGSVADLLLFPEPLFPCRWGFGGNLSDGKEDCGTPALIGGVFGGVGFTQGVPGCMGAGVPGLLDSG